jgi:hypothetical protein
LGVLLKTFTRLRIAAALAKLLVTRPPPPPGAGGAPVNLFVMMAVNSKDTFVPITSKN